MGAGKAIGVLVDVGGSDSHCWVMMGPLGAGEHRWLLLDAVRCW